MTAERRPERRLEAAESFGGDSQNSTQGPVLIGHVLARVLQDALNDGSRLYWLKRAEDFENAKPTLDGFHGNATSGDLSRRWRECDQIARACRAKAEMCQFDDDVEDIDLLLSQIGGVS